MRRWWIIQEWPKRLIDRGSGLSELFVAQVEGCLVIAHSVREQINGRVLLQIAGEVCQERGAEDGEVAQVIVA